MANDKTTAPQVDFSRLPRHVAIILDGNGRWAKKRGLPRTAGHAYGAEAFRRIGNYCKAIGIEYLTVYAFSTENWRRPPEEVRTIMSIFDKYMKEALSIMERDKFKMRFFGERSGLSPELQRLMAAAEEKSTHYDGCQMNLCINYGGRDEILHAVRRYAEAYKAGTAPEHTEDVFSGYLYSAGIPDPDLIIRTSGEQRLSNFLPWQGAYSELYFTDVLDECRRLGRCVFAAQHGALAALAARLAVERVGDRVKDRRLAGARVAGDEVEPGRAEHGKVHGRLPGVRAEGGHGQVQRSHGCASRISSMSCAANARCSSLMGRLFCCK